MVGVSGGVLENERESVAIGADRPRSLIEVGEVLEIEIQDGVFKSDRVTRVIE